MSASKACPAGYSLAFFNLQDGRIEFERFRLLTVKKNGKVAMRAVMRTSSSPRRDARRYALLVATKHRHATVAEFKRVLDEQSKNVSSLWKPTIFSVAIT